MGMLEARALCKSYGSNLVLSNIDLQVESGESVAIMGQSGYGKSTLLHCISGMDTVSSGKVFFDGVEMSALSSGAMQKIRLERMGFVFQRAGFLKNLSIVDNIVFPGFQLGKVSRRQVVPQAQSLLERMGIASIAESPVQQVSGGTAPAGGDLQGHDKQS